MTALPRTRRAALGATLALLAATPLRAQARTAPAVLRLPGSTRALALGDAHVAVPDADAVFYNPASLAGVRGLGASLQRYGSAGALVTTSATTAFGRGTVGLGVRALDHAAPCVSCDDAVAPAAGALGLAGDERASSVEAVLGYGLTVRGLRVGAAGKVVSSWVGSERPTTGALDVGASAGSNTMRVALAAQNLAGADIEAGGASYALPRRVTLGAATAFPRPVATFVDLGASAAVSIARGGSVVPAGGVEIGFAPLEDITFQARLGARRPDDDGSNPVTWGLAFLGGGLAVEYAWQGFAGAPDAHRVGLRWR